MDHATIIEFTRTYVRRSADLLANLNRRDQSTLGSDSGHLHVYSIRERVLAQERALFASALRRVLDAADAAKADPEVLARSIRDFVLDRLTALPIRHGDPLVAYRDECRREVARDLWVALAEGGRE